MSEYPVPNEADGAEPADYRGVVVGWTHNDLGTSINLRLQSATSKQALDEERIDSHHFLMTYNQALMLAKFLLDATGQSLPRKAKPSLRRRLFGERNK